MVNNNRVEQTQKNKEAQHEPHQRW